VNVERDVIDGADFASAAGFSPEHRFAMWINLGKVTDFEKRHGLYSRF
jgi:hypothetical protein